MTFLGLRVDRVINTKIQKVIKIRNEEVQLFVDETFTVSFLDFLNAHSY